MRYQRGSIKCNAIYHHLNNIGTNSIVMTIGEIHKETAVDENGEEVDGDKIIAIFAWYMKENGILPEEDEEEA